MIVNFGRFDGHNLLFVFFFFNSIAMDQHNEKPKAENQKANQKINRRLN